MSEDNRTPFSLGFEGEYWSATLHGLVVPTGYGTSLIALRNNKSGFKIASSTIYIQVEDDLLMLAATIRNYLDTH